jgi:GTP cyclohydrolase I
MTRDEKAARLTKAFEDMLRAVDRSPGRYPDLLDTPVRAANTWLDDLLCGYDADPAIILQSTMEARSDQGMIVIRNLFFQSVCPHHLLPCHGIAHIAYVPTSRIVGFSRIAELLDCFSRRLTLQEQIVKDICDALTEYLGAAGAACIIDAEQFCMVMRGVRKPGSRAVTSEYTGKFREDPVLRREFLTIIGAEE